LSETIRNLERELSVTLLDRRRSGAVVSQDGRELLPYITNVLEAVDRLREASDQQHRSNRMVRLGTVNAATVTVLAPAMQSFRRRHARTQVEVIPAQQVDIHRALREGSLDLGLVNALAGDDPVHDLDTTRLLRGKVVVCLRPDSRLAALDVLTRQDLLEEPLIVMRAGYLMHRFVHRFFDQTLPSFSYSTDGAEMGKLMVAEGLGVTLLPDYSVSGDPLERHGAITTRPLAGTAGDVELLLQGRRSPTMPGAVRDLHRELIRRSLEHPQSAAVAL
jgi:DNA-binding transcriptional LysR family regulator